MTNAELEARLHVLVRSERRITVEVLSLLSLAQARKIYLDQGYPSLFEWLVKKLGYSEGAAYRRVQAARLLEAVPAVAATIASGNVSLFALARTQSAIQMEEKRSGRKLTAAETAALVGKISAAGSAATEQVLSEHFPAREVRQKISVTLETMGALREARDLLASRLALSDISSVVHWLAKNFLSTQGDTSVVSRSVRAQVLRRDQRRCQYKDPVTGHYCHSRFRIEVDHIQPRALGGKDTLENLRCLCRAHNQHRAEQTFGRPYEKSRRAEP